MSSGSGGAVMIARAESDIRALPERLAGCERVVVEEFQPFARTFCLNFAADYKGETHFIGSADQVVADDGTYPERVDRPRLRPTRFGRRARARHRSARGGPRIRRLCGIRFRDPARRPDACLRPEFPDLLQHDRPALVSRNPPATVGDPIRILNASASIPFESLCRLARGLVEEGIVFPFGAFDPTGISGLTGRRPLGGPSWGGIVRKPRHGARPFRPKALRSARPGSPGPVCAAHARGEVPGTTRCHTVFYQQGPRP